MKHIYIIAEAGVNHNGDITLAKKMIDTAKWAGADAIKFQTFMPDALVTTFAPKASYQKETTVKKESHYQMLKRLQLTYAEHHVLIDYCKKKKIEFLSSPFDVLSVYFLAKLGVSTIKIPSGEITHLPYLRAIGKLRKHILLSSGMATMKEIKKTLSVLTACGTPKRNIVVMHCTTEYPVPFCEVNLKAMQTIKNACNVDVGYSDHTSGIEIPIAAAVLGATVIEKHFTLSRTYEGPDHKASLEPGELKTMVDCIRNIECALGTGKKDVALCERKNIKIARKSIVAARVIKKGEHFTEENIIAKRPAVGISPMRWDEVLKRKASKQYKKDQAIII